MKLLQPSSESEQPKKFSTKKFPTKLLLTISFWSLLCIHKSWAWTTFGMGLCIILFAISIDWEYHFRDSNEEEKNKYLAKP